MNNWIEKLKVGDPVIISSGPALSREEISKVTKIMEEYING